MAYLIRPATVSDISFMQELTRQSNTTRHDELSGFLEFEELPTEEYERIVSYGQSLIAEEGIEQLGFLTALPTDQMTLRDPIRTHIAQNYAPGIYFEQLSIIPARRRSNIGMQLRLHGIERAQEHYTHLYGAVATAPKSNTAMLALTQKMGSRKVEEIEFNGMTFGIFSRRL